MTLVLTWLFPFEICMGADSAISYNSYITEPSGRKRQRILTVWFKDFADTKNQRRNIFLG